RETGARREVLGPGDVAVARGSPPSPRGDRRGGCSCGAGARRSAGRTVRGFGRPAALGGRLRQARGPAAGSALPHLSPRRSLMDSTVYRAAGPEARRPARITRRKILFGILLAVALTRGAA